MKAKNLAIVLAICAVIFLSGCGGPTYTISGKVINVDGQGLGGVNLTIISSFNTRQETILAKTDETGAWSAVVQEGAVSVETTKAGWTFTPLEKNINRTESDLEIIGALEGPINFTDPSLEAVVREKIAKTSGDILVSDVIGIKSFDASLKGISSLEGIEYFLSANTIFLNGNQISDISPLVKLQKNLDELWLDHNRIENIELLANLHLKYLLLGYNGVSDMSFLKNLTSLKWLRIEANDIADISFLHDLQSLQYLYLATNQIEDISVLANLTQLEEVNLDGNQLTQINVLLDLPNLKTVSLKNNPKLLLTQESAGLKVIEDLEKRGVTVEY